jgi:hypothetical protein
VKRYGESQKNENVNEEKSEEIPPEDCFYDTH